MCRLAVREDFVINGRKLKCRGAMRLIENGIAAFDLRLEPEGGREGGGASG